MSFSVFIWRGQRIYMCKSVVKEVGYKATVSKFATRLFISQLRQKKLSFTNT